MKIKNLLGFLLILIGAGIGTAGAQTYCIPVASSNTYFVSNFTTTGGVTNISNASGGGITSLGYSNYVSSQSVSGVQGNTINFTATGGASGTYVWRVYVDWNHDSDFIDLGEQVYTNGTTYVTGVTGSFTIPTTALAGPTRIRVFGDYYSTTGAPCTFSTIGPLGEAEDYTFNVISLTPCTGTPTAGTAVAANATPCPGLGTTLSLTGTTLASGLTYLWEVQDPVTLVWGPATGTNNGPTYATPGTSGAATYRAKVTCSTSSMTATSTTVTVTPFNVVLPYNETFESITANDQLPNCMTATNIGTYTKTYIAPTSSFNQTNHTAGGSKFGSFYYGGAGTPQAFVTPGLPLVAGSLYEVKFWYITDGYTGWNDLGAYFGTTNTTAGLTNLIGTKITNPINTTYQQFTGRFVAPTTGTYFVGIVANYNSVPYYLTIDDISIVALPPCSAVVNAGGALSTTNSAPCLGTTVTLSMSNTTTTASGLVYEWYRSTTSATSGFSLVTTPVNPTVYTTGPIGGVEYYYAKLKCSLPGGGVDSTPVITITPNIPTLPYLETFESITVNNGLPNCMSANSLGTNTFTYTTNQTSYNRTNHTTGGSKSAAFYPTGLVPPALFTPAFNLVAGKTYEFSFWYRTGNASNGPAGTEWLSLRGYYGTGNNIGAMTNLIGSVRNPPINNTAYRQFVELFTPAVSGTYFMGIIATHNSSTASYITIDDIGLVELPPCSGVPFAGGAPVALSNIVCPGDVTDLTPDTSAAVTYRSNITYTWQYRIGATGIWTTVPVSPSSGNRRYTTEPINDTTYYRVAMTCNNSGSSDTSLAVRIDPNFPSLPYLQTFESITGNNVLPTCMTASDLGGGVLTYTAAQAGTGRTNHTPGGTKFATIAGNYGTTDALYTPGFPLQANRTYEFSFWYQVGNTSSTTANNFTSVDARVGTQANFGTMANLGSIRPTPVNNSGYKQFITTFRPTASGVYYFGVSAIRTNTTGAYLSIDDIGITQLPECSGKPASGGTPVAVTTTLCPGTITQIELTGASNNGNQTITWEQSIDGGVTWTAVTAPGYGFNSRYLQTPPVNAITRYRAVTACAGSLIDTTRSTEVIITPNFLTAGTVETFESITANDQMPGCWTATNLGTGVKTYLANQASGNRINHTVGGSKFATFSSTSATTNGIFSPGINLVAGKTYLFKYWYTTGTSGIGGASNVASLSSWYGTDPSIAGMTIPIGSVQTPLTNTAYQQFQETFIPAASGLYYLGILSTTTSATTAYVTVDDIGIDTLLNCTGKPVAGTITAVTPCPNVPFTLRTTGGTSRFTVAGLAYEWQDSTVNGWNLASGVTATTSDYTTSIAAPRAFRLIITCTASGQKDTSLSYMVNLQPFYNCYCIPTYAVGAGTSGITNVKLRNLNNTSSIVMPYYTDYTTQQPGILPIPLLTMTVADTLSVTMSSNTTNYTGVWVDFNHNSVFDANEFYTNNSASTGANGKAEVLITPPATALFGLTRMRIRSGDRAVVTASMACGPTGSSYGEAEDYFVTIQYPPCAGPVNAGAALTSDASTCPGYSIDLTDTTHEYRMSGISWDWQSSLDGGLSWNPVTGSAGKDTLHNVLITRAISYRVHMYCANTGDSTYSTPADITIKPPYACYCVSQSTGTAADVSDIGAVQLSTMINNTGGPHILNPLAVRRHTFYTELTPIALNADGTYRLSVYHIQRNAVHENARVSVFLDYNNDLVYNAAATPNSERVFTDITTAGDFYIDTVLRIPNAVIPNAPTGMRIILNADLDPNAPANLGCGEYLSGETEDYVVRFTRFPSGIGTVSGNVETMSLYPNPTTGRFTVTVTGTKSLGSVEVNVTTITGQRVLRTTAAEAGVKYTADLDLGGVARGIYFVEIKTQNGEKITRKLSVK